MGVESEYVVGVESGVESEYVGMGIHGEMIVVVVEIAMEELLEGWLHRGRGEVRQKLLLVVFQRYLEGGRLTGRESLPSQVDSPSAAP